MKLKRLFNGKNQDNETEISGSFGGEASSETLLGDNSTKKEDSKWDAWSFRDNNGDANRGRSNSRLSLRRSSSVRASSERPAYKRSKSEVGKRLKKLEVDFGSKSKKKKGGSKSVGGTFKGKSADVKSKIDSLALKRSGSDTKLEQSGFDSLFDRSESERTERTCTTAKPAKKLRGGRRKSVTEEDSNKESDPSRRRSRSTSTRRKRTASASSSRRKRSTSAKPRRKSVKDPPEEVNTDDKYSVSTLHTKESKKKKKKKKNKDDSSVASSIPSKVDMNDCESQSSGTINGSAHGKKKKTKDKEKSKKSKQRSKSKLKYPELPAEDFGNGLEGLADEFRRSKEKYGKENTEQGRSKNSSEEIPNTEDKTEFENAWSEKGQNNTQIERSQSFPDENRNGQFVKHGVEDDPLQPQITAQQEEILQLQQQLSTALQKQLTMSEEHIKERNEFMNISRDLERVRVELAEAREERHEVVEELKERDRIVEEDRNKINNLEQAIDKQLEKEEELVKNVQHSEEEIVHLLDEIQKFETKLDDGDTNGGGASFVELRNTQKALSERNEESASLKLRIEQLEKELRDSMTVPQLQIEELDQENKALKGRLKGERLEYTSKLSSKDVTIQSLRTELTTFTASPDAQDLQSALQKLSDAREDAKTVRGDLATTVKRIETLHGEREDVMEEFNLMKDNNVFMEKTVRELTEKADSLAKKVLDWTEKTYDWKQRAETAERKINEANENQEKAGSDMGEADPQGMFLHAAMEKGKTSAGGRKGSWGIFKKNSHENQELSSEDVRVRVLEEQNYEYEAKIALLSSDIVKMQAGHKDELYSTKKRIAQLEGENEALNLQNSTLEELHER